jgi:hypothetical protein
MTRQRIKFLDKTHLTQKDTDAFVGVLKRATRGNLSSEDRIWLKKKAVFYKEKAQNSLPFMQDHKSKSGNPNPSPKAEKPKPTSTPVTQPSQKVGDPSRKNPNLAAGKAADGRKQTAADASVVPNQHREVLTKLKQGQRLTKEDYVLLRQLKKEGKLSQTQQTLLTARIRLNKSNRIAKVEQQVAPATQPVAAPAPPAPAPPPVATTTVAKYTDADLKSMLSKGGKLPDDFPAYPNAARQLRESSKTPDLSLKRDGDYSEQVEEFARAVADVAKKSPLSDQENVCLLLSHKIAQANRPIENFGRTLYDRALAMLSGGAEVNKKVNP